MPPPPIRPTSQPPTYAEAISHQAYTHEPVFIVLSPVRREVPEDVPKQKPVVHDISAGDRFVAMADIGIRKAIKKLTPGNNKSDVKEDKSVKSSS